MAKEYNWLWIGVAIIVAYLLFTGKLQIPFLGAIQPIPNDDIADIVAPTSEFDNLNYCGGMVGSSTEELIEHAHVCVDFLQSNGLIRSDRMTPFEIDKYGNLQRNHFVCGCGSSATCGNKSGCGCIDNCHKSQAPEYMKCWKSENNAGCSCSKKSSCNTTASGPVVVTQRNARF